MKKLFLSTATALALVFTSMASETNSWFKANELSLTASSGYVTDSAKSFDADNTTSLNLGAGYFLTKHFGAEASVPFYQSDGISFNELQAGLVARLPLQTPKVQIAPYVGLGGIYSWNANTGEYTYRVKRKTFVGQYDDKELSYVVRLGVEGRINAKWGAFVEAQYRNVSLANLENGSTKLLAGVRFVF